MELIAVKDKETARAFIEVNFLLNRHLPGYIRPLDKDIEAIFDPARNKALRHAETARWILRDGDGMPLGRIAAFVNEKYRNPGDDMRVGGIGFFDCINDADAAAMLFDVAKHWLIQRGMEAMDGPINCGERDRWWGLLVEGFDPPLYGMNFNPPYYKDLFEGYGFRKYYNQYCYALKVVNRLQDVFYVRHARLSRNPHFKAQHIRKNQLDKFADDFTYIYNKAWAGHGGMKELTQEAVRKMFRQMRPVMDEKIVWFVYYDGEPIALWVNLPDLNQWFKYLNGRFGLLAKLKLLWLRRTVPITKFMGLVFGVIPEWQGKGVDAYMIIEGAKLIQGTTAYQDYEMQWIGEWNPRMLNIAEKLGTYRSRTLRTYRYLFDQTGPFREHPIY